MFDRIATPFITSLMFVALPGSAEEPEMVLLNDKVLVCDAEGCTEILSEDTAVQTSAAEPIIETPSLKPESQSEIEPEPDSQLPVVDNVVDEPAAPQNTSNSEPGESPSVFNSPGAQWMMTFAAMGILVLAGLGFWAMARKRGNEAVEDATADEVGETIGTPDSAHLSVRNINILDDRFSKFEIDIANADQSPAASITMDARIIVHRLEKDPGDASVTAEKKASEIVGAMPGDAARKVTLGIFLYRGIFKDRNPDQTAYDVEVNGSIHWTDATGENLSEEFVFCAPAIKGENFVSGSESSEPSDRGIDDLKNPCFSMLPMSILDYYASNMSQ